jgi:AcrR family transcriptional regulator
MAVIPQHQESHADDTRSRLEERALSLFATKGYDATSVREIIEAAGVTRPVLYYYFQNKADLFCCLIETQFERTFAAMDEIVARFASCRERLKGLIRNEFSSAERSPETVRFLLRYFFAPPQEAMRLDSRELAQARFERIVRVMAEGREAGELSGGDPSALALAFSGLMDLHVMAKGHDPEVSLDAELGDALVELFMSGAAKGGVGLEGLRPVVQPFDAVDVRSRKELRKQ